MRREGAVGSRAVGVAQLTLPAMLWRLLSSILRNPLAAHSWCLYSCRSAIAALQKVSLSVVF